MIKQIGGLSDARNAGINIAKGKYIGFVDSDDYIEKEMYENLYVNIKKYKAQISMCAYKLVNDKYEIKKVMKEYKNVILYNKIQFMENLLNNQEIISNHAWNKLYKIELFEDVRYPKGKKFEDIGTTYKLIDKCDTIVYENKPLYNYLIRSNSITRQFGY